MEFKIDTVGDYYEAADAKKLASLGFTFEDAPGGITSNQKKTNGPITIRVNTLEELLNLSQEHGELILTVGPDWASLTIYDYYIE